MKTDLIKLREKVKQHNEVILSYGTVLYCICVDTGAKGKKLTLSANSVYKNRYGELKKSIYKKNKRLISYLKSPMEVLDYIKKYPYKRYLVFLEKIELNDFKTNDIPTYKFIPFGKYAKQNIDNIALFDTKYTIWLKEYVNKNESYNSPFKEYLNTIDIWNLIQNHNIKTI